MKNISIKPVRVQRLRKKGFKLQDASHNGLPVIYVGRPTKWGNPFKVGKHFIPMDEIILNPFNPKWETCKDIDQCLQLYKEHLERELKYKRLNIEELRGKNLSCWCAMDCLCHADILLELATKVERHYR